ncbi:MAG TPA: DNA double-strand break repair nuclease NurA [Candidatus Limnocylindrales bacterium]|nr:DNA double-strand break repair nuclease NurA [Candidatus Limnocylindrales bacterium]
MGLEFTRLLDQVDRMGSYLAHRSDAMADKVDLAVARLDASCDLAPIYTRIERVRRSSVSGYRGAAPLPEPFGEIVCGVGAAPDAPSPLILVAADGSQVYPNRHGQMLYYLTNISLFHYYAGLPYAPAQRTLASLVYSDDQVRDKDGRQINNKTVDARRTLLEMQTLAREGWDLAQQMNTGDAWTPILLLYDGNLLKVFGANEVSDGPRIERQYLKALAQARDAGVLLAGYVDRPSGVNLISLLHLLGLAEDGITETALKTNGDMEGVTDEMLCKRYLEPGQRSALLALNSPQNREYKEFDDDLEIAFFYVNVGVEGDPAIARADMPMWVARKPELVSLIHGALVAQCAIQGRQHYPYALTRADELAYVNGQDRAQLEQLIRVALRRHRLSPEASHKLQTKGLARGQRRQHRLRA